jgi:hypothetical protein
MPETDWLNINDFREYPLEQGADLSLTSGGLLPQRGLVDAGFVMGVESEFDITDPLHDVYLDRVVRGVTSLTFVFKSDAPGFAGYEFQFPVALDEEIGATFHVDAVLVATGEPDFCKGTAFLVVGALDDMAELTVDTHTLIAAPKAEPALTQSLVGALAKTINAANALRPCPPNCCDPTPSSSSSSSSSQAPVPDDLAVPDVEAAVGDVQLKPGYNATVKVIETFNAIEIGAGVGSGAGEPCDDIRVTENGLLVDENCQGCRGFIYSINGQGRDQTHLLLAAGPGIDILPDPEDSSGLVVSVDPEKLCEVS